jgi:hypothetical protein
MAAFVQWDFGKGEVALVVRGIRSEETFQGVAKTRLDDTGQ